MVLTHEGGPVPETTPVDNIDSAPMNEKADDGCLTDAGPAAEAPPVGVEPEYPLGPKFVLVVFALCLVIFVVTLDMTVVATAAPAITDEFNSLGDIGWYNSVYFMTICISQLLFGKLAFRYPISWNYSAAMFLFLVGSAVCGSATSSSALIAGRAIAGLGCSGLLVGTFSLVPVLAAPLRRPILIGLIGGSLGLGTACGPLIGGALTENVTWRWNFYINLPIGAFSYAVFYLFVHTPKEGPSKAFTSWLDLLETLDLIGLAALSGSVTCLLLALQWGGTQYPWNDGRIIALLVLFFVFAGAFLGVEFWLKDKAMLPPRIFTQTAVIATVWFCFFTSGSSFLLAYYIPLWFQGVEGASPFLSGVNTLPLVLANTIASFSCGMLLPIVGRVWPFMLFASITTALGSGLFTTFQVSTPTGHWIGYQIIYGVGMGLSSQTPLMSAQNILPDEDVPIGSGVVMFTQTIAGAIFTAVAQALFANNLVTGLTESAADADPTEALTGGLTTLTAGLEGKEKLCVLQVINDALTNSWLLPVTLTSISVLGAAVLAVKNQKIKGKEGPKPQEQDISSKEA